jgi:hypothetical protein
MNPTEPIDYAFAARVKKAGDLADKLMAAGWEPGVVLTDETWIQATIATGRKSKKGKEIPSDETKLLTLKLLEERWKERKGQ